MENRNKKQKLAYLCSLPSTNQCELQFPLCDSINGIVLNEEIKAVRSITDTVGSMLQHIRNKLNKLIKTKSEGAACTPVEFALRLEYEGGTAIEWNVILQSLIRKVPICVFYILKERFKVIVDAPLVQLICLPAMIFEQSVVQPEKFEAIRTKKYMCQNEWYRSTDKKNWVKVGQSLSYKIQDSDLGHYLKFRCVPKTRQSVLGPCYEVISESTVMKIAQLPTKCPFEDRHLHTPTKLTGKQFRFVCYNILSNRYAKDDQFPYCPLEYLAIEYRRKLLLKEIVGYKADVICLQELDHREYEHFFQYRFNKLGYESVFHRKGDCSSEGMGCIYNAKKFEKIYSEQLVLRDKLGRFEIFKRIKESVHYGPDVETLQKLVTSLQVTVLQSKILNKRLIVANTHLYYHPNGYQIRVIQVAMITAFLNDLRKQFQQDYKGNIGIILCGDFNSMPTSAVYNFLSNSKIEDEHMENLSIIKNAEGFTHSFKFNSACGTPEYTNFTKEFKACLDYIFYDKRCLKSLGFVPFPDESVLSENIALPSKVFPSDHLALVADLQFL